MYCVDIQITNNQKVFHVGDTITGTALITVPIEIALSSVSLSFHCRGGLKWIDLVDMWHYLDNNTCYESNEIFKEKFDIDTSKTVIQLFMSSSDPSKNITIPFSFTIPQDKELPSTMVSSEGYVKYFFCLKLQEEETKNFYKEVIVLAPFYKNLMVTVGATAEKSVLLHSGTVSLHASIGRKGFAPGEIITVHVSVDNQTNTKVVPKLSLNQTQIYSSGSHLKIMESILHEEEETIRGTVVEPHARVEQVLTVTIPENKPLSIKSSFITVKHFICVNLEIPHSFDLHVSLPLVVTSKAVIEQLQTRKDDPFISN